MKTYSAKATDVIRKWYILDASQVPTGRLATQAATFLLGKHKPMFTRHVDCGDYVIVINAASLVVTGNKMLQKKYYHYSKYPSGLRETALQDQLVKDPTKVITHAVKGMLPTNKLLAGRLKRLKVYAGAEHEHEAQKPELISLKEGK